MNAEEKARLADAENDFVLSRTRRHFFNDCGIGLGSIALANMLGTGKTQAAASLPRPEFTPKAKNVICLFMAGGPSQFEMLSNKPKLGELDGQVAPDSFFPKEKNFAFIGKGAKLLGSRRKFKRYGKSGKEISELLPHSAGIADDLCFLDGMTTDVFNHGPAKLFMNTGFQVPGRPSMGAWVTYGLGSESSDLPGFVVLPSGPRGPRSGNALWSSGFLPTSYQGVPFRNSGDPILNLNSPKGIDSDSQNDFFKLVGDLNRKRLETTGDPEIATRIAAGEMAYRMQTSAPELMDIKKESKIVLERYGAEPGANSYANNCLLARRLIERGVRFVQLYHSTWDDHANLNQKLTTNCGMTDQPTAALLTDLERRGLLDETLVIWGAEFGRTPMAEVRRGSTPGKEGRDHHPFAFSMWMAGGGIRGGQVVGKTDELGYHIVEDPVHVHDLHATILHCLGLDHLRLTYRHQGRDFRLTDVAGTVVKKLLA